MNRYSRLNSFSGYENQELATHTKNSSNRLMNPQLNKVEGQENVHVIPLHKARC